MSKLIVLFNLSNEEPRADYEEWARNTDLPTIRELQSVDAFDVHRVTGLLRSDSAAPYGYVEIIDINSMDQFGADISPESLGRVAAEFREFADNPIFMLTTNLEVGGH